MRPVTMIVLLCVLCSLAGGHANSCWAWGKKPLAVIDGQEYFADEYRVWWEYWRESEKQKPESVQPFVNWMLMVREAERMDLSSLPEFKHKVDVFLEARTLMYLKRDEIDSKIDIQDVELKTAYDHDYVPRRLVGALEFSAKEEAKKFNDQYAGQALSIEQLQMMADEKPAPPFVLQQPQWLRPVNTPGAWRTVLDQATSGSLRGPLPLGEKTALLYVAEVRAGDEDDYAKKKESIKNDLRKQREQTLTEQLVNTLKEKYHVRLDEQVLAKINLTDPGANDRKEVVIESDRSKVTVGYFLDQSRRETDITHRLPADTAAQMLMKQRLANTMIANSLVSWEGLSRHYEEKEPLRAAYQFYRQNRLMAELENRSPGDIQVADAEVSAYYQGHLEDFKRPEMILGVMVAGDEAVIRKVWAEAISGTELVKSAESNGVTVAVSPGTEVPLQHFSETAQKVLAALKTGDMSQPFLDSGRSVVIKLNERKAGSAAPLEMVAGAIKDRIVAEKKAKRKQGLLEALSSRSTVVVNDDVWPALAAEYQ